MWVTSRGTKRESRGRPIWTWSRTKSRVVSSFSPVVSPPFVYTTLVKQTVEDWTIRSQFWIKDLLRLMHASCCRVLKFRKARRLRTTRTLSLIYVDDFRVNANLRGSIKTMGIDSDRVYLYTGLDRRKSKASFSGSSSSVRLSLQFSDRIFSAVILYWAASTASFSITTTERRRECRRPN